jgi:nifR3 family TIM-barrel protein
MRRLMRLRHLTVDPPTVLAPMAGITTRDFRQILRRIGGVGLVTMEFVNSKDVVANSKLAQRTMAFDEVERPLSIQIYGGDAAIMAEAAARVEALGADACDINMGCPANKILKGCRGAALMGDLDLARRIVAAVRRELSIPLTVKFRLGLEESRKNYLELGRICQEEGADAVALHARTAADRFGGSARWHEIGHLKAALSIPVIGNGDILTADDAVAMLASTDCDAVMVGRGATRNPWIFREIAARLAGAAEPEVTLADRRRLILGHFRQVLERDEPVQALHTLKTFTSWYSHGLPAGERLRRRLGELSSAAAVLGAVADHLDHVLAHAA